MIRALRYVLIPVVVTIFAYGMGIAFGIISNPLPPMLFGDSYVLAACWLASEASASLYRWLRSQEA